MNPAKPAKISIDWQFEDKRWQKVRGLKPKLLKAAQAILTELPEFGGLPLSVSLLCTSNHAIQKLNFDFRGVDKPTNVLAFPQFEPKALRRNISAKAVKTPLFLGDVVFGYQYIVDEAKNDRKILINHLSHLIIHAILHLLGYDHLDDRQANRMERLEKKIMQRLGFPDPYADVAESFVVNPPVSRPGKVQRKSKKHKSKTGRTNKLRIRRTKAE